MRYAGFTAGNRQSAHAGYALADRQIEVGLCSLAVPLLSRSGQVVAALNVGVPAGYTNAAALKEKALAPLRRAAMALSLQL
jgi:IclR family pca regulon transcriptional regulator